MRKEPLFVLIICFVLGIFVQDYFVLRKSVVLALVLFGISLFGLFWIKGYLFFRIRPAIVGIFLFVLGIGAHFFYTQDPEFPTLTNKEALVFKITKKLNTNEKNRRYEILAWKDQKSFNCVLSYPKDIPELDYTHYYKANVYLNKLEKPYADFQFDYRKYLARKGIYLQAYIAETIQHSERHDLSFAEEIKQRRLILLSKIDLLPISKQVREFTKGIILADRTEMDAVTVTNFRDSGTMHILAISGTHMAIIFGVILLLLNFIFPPKFRVVKIITSLLLIWSFALFIDFGNSVIRSCVMITCYYVLILRQNKTDLLHALSLAGFIILVFNTNQLFDVGFQLSFAAVFGIYWFNRPILRYLPDPKNRTQNFLLNILSISIAAQLATTPFVIYYFHQYSFISIVANLVIIPFAEILIVFALLIVFLSAISLHIIWIYTMYDEVVSATLTVIHYFAEVEFAMHRLIPLTLLELMLLLLITYLLRFVITHFSIKTVARLLYFILLFISVRWIINFRALQLDEVFVHKYFKEQVISQKSADQVVFYCSSAADRDKIQQYIIDPYLTSRRLKKYEVKVKQDNRTTIIIKGQTYVVGQ